MLRIAASPLVIAVAFGLLNPSALEEDDVAAAPDGDHAESSCPASAHEDDGSADA